MKYLTLMRMLRGVSEALKRFISVDSLVFESEYY